MNQPDPKLSLCMIVRDEEKMLPDCLASVAGLVHEIIVVDTGSADGTARIAKDHGARVLAREWRDDFAAARNASLEPASGEWVLWIDADERLRRDEHDRIRRSVREGQADCFLVPIVSPVPTGAQVTRGHRLFRNAPYARFSGRIHEQIGPALQQAGARIAPADFSIDHLGYDLTEAQQQAKNERNIRLLLAAKKDNPRNSYVRFTLAQTYMLMGDKAAAEKELRAALGETASDRMRKPQPADIRASAYTNLAQCALERGAPVEALARCRESLSARPGQLSAHLMAYKAHKALRQEEEALRELRTVEQLRADASRPGAAIEIAVEPGDLWRAMGYCCLRLGRADEARAHFTKAIRRTPDHARTLAALARCDIAENRLDSALQLAERAFAAAPRDDSLLDLVSFILLRQGRLEQAAERIGHLCLRRPRDTDLKRRLAGVLVKLGRVQEAADLIAGLDGLPASGLRASCLSA